ncbi:alpha(1,3)fucosyltransferase,putative [Schistosoma mansoni]|uniref:alpha(1,3)fucosyltransferase,putative n=1 Tax=Schistosoma mansoni TaxID=6183 RepID=UPI00022C816A|nr:alpha(1,3)fucosyltransferase,putative [Schistosoma mansoni]|eukprot:XP_018647110.1 alpha(1,3)fucosyltransferase,putative [Schistosoma mansoni]
MIVQRGKWTLRIKAIGFVLIALFIVWLINISPSLLYVGIHNESYTYLSDNMGLIHKDIFDSNSSELELAMILHKSYSTIYETSVQKYSLRFDVEENRLKRLFDSLSKNTSVKTFLNYGSQKIYTPMDFSKCYASKCTVITEMERWHEADALILTKNVKPDGIRPLGQLWFTLIHESPEHISLANTLDNEKRYTSNCDGCLDRRIYLDKNDTAYNEYFAWHGHGIIHDWDSQPQCAMCLLAHTSQAFGPYWVPKVARWWNDGCKDHKLRWNP